MFPPVESNNCRHPESTHRSTPLPAAIPMLVPPLNTLQSNAATTFPASILHCPPCLSALSVLPVNRIIMRHRSISS